MKKKLLSPGLPLAAPAEFLAERGSEALRLGRFKEAIEIFKQLARQDKRPEWTGRLADAYAGRARALADKGMFREAAQVLENTRTADGTVREPVLYLTSLINQGQYQKAQQMALQHIDRLPAAEASRLADMAAALTLALPARPQLQGIKPHGPAVSPWAKPGDAAQAALGAWLQGEPAEAVDLLLHHIPLRSPFGPLRLILKSLITSPDAAGKARGLLTMIPAASPFASARAAAEATLTNDPAELAERWSTLRPAQQSFVAEARGAPRTAAALLQQIVEAEQRGPAALFALLARPGLSLPEHDLRTACLNLLPELPDLLAQFERRFGAVSALEQNRVLALAAEARGSWRTAQTRWEAVAATLAQQTAPEARLGRGVVFRHLADLAQHHAEVRGARGVDTIADFLERSLEADPDHLPATLTLLEQYRTGDSPKEWHRAAEQAAQRFPGNTTILLHALDAAVARDAYKKAAGFAHRLLTLDPINQPVRQRMIELQLAHARKQARTGRSDLAGKALAQAAEWERPDAPSAPLRIGQALVAMGSGQDPAAEGRLRDAVDLAGDGVAGWFRAVLEAALMGWSEQHRTLLQRELAAAQSAEPDRETILALVGILSQKEIRERGKVVASVLWRIEPTLTGGSRLAWSPAEFQTIAAALHHLKAFEVLRAYAREAMRRDPEDQAARFYRIVAQIDGDLDRLTGAQEAELDDLMDQAGQRQDFHLFNRVQRFLDGPDTGRNGAGRSADMPDLSVEEVDEMLGDTIAGLAGMPPKELRKLVNRFGQDRAVDMLTERVADSPLGDVMSDQQVAQLCAAIVARATEGRAQQARR